MTKNTTLYKSKCAQMKTRVCTPHVEYQITFALVAERFTHLTSDREAPGSIHTLVYFLLWIVVKEFNLFCLLKTFLLLNMTVFVVNRISVSLLIILLQVWQSRISTIQVWSKLMSQKVKFEVILFSTRMSTLIFEYTK